MKDKIKNKLLSLAQDPVYQKFNAKLIPNIAPERILGIRMPILRKLAAEIARGDDWREYLTDASKAQPGSRYHEEVLLHGLVIGLIKVDLEERLDLIRSFIPQIDNWAVCDSFCSGLKTVQKYREEIWTFITPYLENPRPYFIRFGVVMALEYFSDEAHAPKALSLLDKIHHEDYYVKMAVAWALSIYFVKSTATTMAYLKKNNLDDWTYNKALQKILESYRVDSETKENIRKMKRKAPKRKEKAK